MGADVIRTELTASGDRRVRAGLRGAIEHVAGRHGMSAAEQREFASEVDRECCKLNAHGEAGASCEVIVEEQEDQIEVRVRPSSESSMAPQTSSRRTASVENSKHNPVAEYPGRGRLADRAADNGHRAVTLVRPFHKNPAHS